MTINKNNNNLITIGNYVMRAKKWDEYSENDPERELSINKKYEVLSILSNGKLILEGFISPVRVEMIRRVNEV